MFGGRVLQSRRGSAVPIGRAAEAYEKRLHSQSQLSSCPRSACGRQARLQDHRSKQISICAAAFAAVRAGGLMSPTGRLKFSAGWWANPASLGRAQDPRGHASPPSFVGLCRS